MRNLGALALSLWWLAAWCPAQDAKPYKAIDQHALKAPPEAEASLDSLAEYLAKPCKTDRDKARAIYRWITDRIAYDVERF
ncbi:MAG: transglutaminase-like domain-containing protein, partial [Gemmataceae bacterium]|nr:transglutaminase-like domain-containing protein [Gemmataceae bacterium]